MGGTLSRPMLDHKLFLHVYTIHNTIYTTYIHDVMESVKVHDDRFVFTITVYYGIKQSAKLIKLSSHSNTNDRKKEIQCTKQNCRVFY